MLTIHNNPVFWSLVGGAPGAVLYGMGYGNASITVAILGAGAGFLLCFARTTVGPIWRFLLAWLISVVTTIPVFFLLSDGDDPEDRAANLAADSRYELVSTFKWHILVAVLAGALAGWWIGFRDVRLFLSGNQGWLLPIPGAKDSLTAQIALLSIGCSIWTGVLTATLLDRWDRRILLVALASVFCFGAALGITIDKPFQCGLLFSTPAGAFALYFCATNRVVDLWAAESNAVSRRDKMANRPKS